MKGAARVPVHRGESAGSTNGAPRKPQQPTPLPQAPSPAFVAGAVNSGTITTSAKGAGSSAAATATSVSAASTEIKSAHVVGSNP